jgi:tRNA A37 N6-isopentenylltransferase MiaA
MKPEDRAKRILEFRRELEDNIDIRVPEVVHTVLMDEVERLYAIRFGPARGED